MCLSAGVEIRPTTEQKRVLENIVESPSRQLSDDERKLIWKFREQLSTNPRALTKFLRCVHDWRMELEVDIALEMMNRWAQIGVADALELLSGTFTHPIVRQFAVSVLQSSATDDVCFCSHSKK